MRRPGQSRIVPAESSDSLLIGWAEISRYMRRRPRCLQYWVKRKGVPIIRVGRNVATSRGLIDHWLMAYGRQMRQRMTQAQFDRLK
jgi:hypothetical protein